MKKIFLLLGIASAFNAPAFAEMAVPGGTPRLEFAALPAKTGTRLEHKVMPYRIFDKMVISVEDPVYCGQEAVNPTFAIEGGRLLVNYELTPQSSDQRCVLVSQFVVSNVPHRNLDVHFAGGAEPYAVAMLGKCPNYTPKSDDVWECLVPESALR